MQYGVSWYFYIRPLLHYNVLLLLVTSGWGGLCDIMFFRFYWEPHPSGCWLWLPVDDRFPLRLHTSRIDFWPYINTYSAKHKCGACFYSLLLVTRGGCEFSTCAVVVGVWSHQLQKKVIFRIVFIGISVDIQQTMHNVRIWTFAVLE